MLYYINCSQPLSKNSGWACIRHPFVGTGSSLGPDGVTGISEADLCVVDWQVSAVYSVAVRTLLNPSCILSLEITTGAWECRRGGVWRW